MTTSSLASAARPEGMLDTLLILSRSLTGAKQGGMLADALDLLLAGIGCTRGAAYTVTGDSLDLVGERGLPTALREHIQHLPLVGPPWFVAQRAAQTCKLVADRHLGAAPSPIPEAAISIARWGQAVACPIASGREVFGVLVFAWPTEEEPSHVSLPVVEIACNMIAVHTARLRREHEHVEARHGDMRDERMAAVGILAGGFAEDLDAQLAELARRLRAQERLPAEALRPARETTARLLSAIRPAAPERVDLVSIAADVLALTAPHLRRRRIDVRLRAAGAHFVVGRRNDLVQVLLQLVLRMGGVLDDADEVYSDRSALIPRSFLLEVRRERGHEVVSLADAGDEATGARSSFFDLGEHMDLGIVRRLVVAHEGHIEVRGGSDPAGAQCTLVFPAADARRLTPRPAPLGRRLQGGDPKPILLWIDEDELFTQIMVQSLQELDIRVAPTAADATRLLSSGLVPSLVLCNVRLPDHSGPALHAEIARRIPEVGAKFVFVTDGVVSPEAASYLVTSGRPTLTRPIDPEQVRAMAQQGSTSPTQAMAPTLTDLRADRRRAETAPAISRVFREPADEREALPPPAPPPPAPPPPAPPPARTGLDFRTPGMRDQELSAIARAAAETLRREGPKRGGAVLTMLRSRGLSELEALSVITFALSSGIIARDAPPSALLRAPGAEGRHKNILVVDDDLDLRQTLREVLQEEGYTVDTAANGREALQVLRRGNPPRVMVLDLMMPVMDGWQLLDELKRDDAIADIPVVVISAGKVGNRAPGTHEVLSKPLDYHKLVATIDRSMRPG